MDQRYTILSCALFSFALTTTVCKLILDYLLLYSIPYIPTFVLALLASLPIYTVIFKLSVTGYSYIISYISPIYSIRGTWYHITKIKKPVKGIRYGEVSITNDLGSVLISGDNFDENGEYRSSFHSLATYLDHSQLLMLYQSEGALRKVDRIRNGMMALTIVSKKGRLHRPQILKGSWKDTVPSNYSGSIIFYSNEKEWKTEKEKEIERLKTECSRTKTGKSGELTDESSKE